MIVIFLSSSDMAQISMNAIFLLLSIADYPSFTACSSVAVLGPWKPGSGPCQSCHLVKWQSATTYDKQCAVANPNSAWSLGHRAGGNGNLHASKLALSGLLPSPGTSRFSLLVAKVMEAVVRYAGILLLQ